MTAWMSDELNKIGAAEELEIASIRRNGGRRNPVTIWVVRHGDDIYVRSVNGRTGTWFRGTKCAAKVGSGPAASRKTSPSWMPIPASTIRSTPRTAPSIAATPRVSSEAS